MRLSYNRPSVSLGASRGHSGEIFDARPSVDGRSDREVIHIEGSRVTGQGGKHNRSKSNGSPDGAGTEYNEGSPTEITGNILRGRGENIVVGT